MNQACTLPANLSSNLYSPMDYIMLKQQIKKLESILSDTGMDLPPERIKIMQSPDAIGCIVNHSNLNWIMRNIQVRNRNHPQCFEAIRIGKSIIKLSV